MCRTGDNLLKAAVPIAASYFLGPEVMAAFGPETAAATTAATTGADLASTALPGAVEGFAGTGGFSVAPDLLSGGLGAAPFTASFTPAAAEFGAGLAGSPTLFPGGTGGGEPSVPGGAAPGAAPGSAPGATSVLPPVLPPTSTAGPFAQGLPGAESAAVTPQAGLPSVTAPTGGGAPLGEAGSLAGPAAGAEAPTFTGAPGGVPPATPNLGASFDIPAMPGAGTAAQPSMIQKALDLIGNNKMATATWGLTGLNMLRQKQQGDAYAKMFQGAAAPTQAVEQQLLGKFQNGQISGADQFAIAQFAQSQKAAVNQYYAKAGLSNSSMHTAALAQIDQQAEGMRQQALDNMLKSGLSAAGVTNPLLSAGIQASMSSDTAATNAMQNFLQTMARINTPQANTPPQSQTGSPTTP